MRVVSRDGVHRFVVADGAGGLGGGAQAAEDVTAALTAEVADWRAWLDRLDARVTADAGAGESTAVAGQVGDGRIVGASVGDSEAWTIGPDFVERLTADQNRERLGSGRARAVAFEAEFTAGAVLVIASDGLFRGASADAIVEAVRAGVDARALAEVARGRSGRLYDDVGVVVIGSPR